MMKSLAGLDLSGLKNSLIDKRQQMERLISDHVGESRPVELDQTRVGRLTRMVRPPLQCR